MGDNEIVQVAWDQEEATFPARLARNPDGSIQLWNGWVVPLFDREQANRIVKINDEIIAKYGPVESVDAFRWYGDVLVERWMDSHETEWPAEVPPEPIDDFDVIKPDAQGLYSVGGWAWTWYVVGPGEGQQYPTRRK